LIVTLDEAKLYLKVDGDEDNTLITSCINTAEELCQDIMRTPFSEFTEVPEAVKQAVFYEEITLKQVGELLGLNDLERLGTAINEALSIAMPEADEEEGEETAI